MYVCFHVAPPSGYTYCGRKQRREEADVCLGFYAAHLHCRSQMFGLLDIFTYALFMHHITFTGFECEIMFNVA